MYIYSKSFNIKKYLSFYGQKKKLTTGGVDGERRGNPAVSCNGFLSIFETIQTLDRVANVVGCADEGAADEAEGGGPVVVEAKDLAIDESAGVADLDYPCQGSQHRQHHSDPEGR